MNNVMIDLETMGTSSNAPIIAIGAVQFDYSKFEGDIKSCFGKELYWKCNLQSNIDLIRIPDGDTISWWMKQSDDARKQFYNIESEPPLEILLNHFSNFIDGIRLESESNEVFIWGNGVAFDNTILAEAYRDTDMKAPWNFREDRCFRTMKAMLPVVTPYEMVHTLATHNALEDAKAQAEYLIRAINL